MGEIVRVFAQLKARLLFNAWRRTARARLGMVVLSAALLAAMTMFVLVVNRAARSTDAAEKIAAAFTALWLAWVGLPFLLGGVDDAVDPDRLAELPLTRTEAAAGTAIAASIGILPAATAGGLLAMAVVLARRAPAAIVLLLLIAVGQFALSVVSSRLLATVLIRASRSRRGRDLGVVVAALISSGLWMATQAINVVGPQTRRVISTVLAWTPAGAFGRAAADSVNGHKAVAALRVIFGFSCVAAMAWWWASELRKSMSSRRSGAPRDVRLARSSRSYVHKRSAGRGLRPAQALPFPVEGVRRAARGPINHPVFVIVRKEFRYLFRSPYRRASLLVGCLFGAPFVLLQSTRMNPDMLPPVAVAPIALLFGIAISHNLLGLDASSLWIELGTGVHLRHLLLGRAMAAAPTLIAPVWLSALLTVVVTGNTRALLPTLALSVVASGVPLGVGALISVLVPFPVSDDSSPFGNQSAMTGRGCLVGIVHCVGLVVAAVLLSPVFAFGVMRGRVDAATVLACAMWSVVVLGSGVWLGERFSNQRPGALAETLLAGMR